MQLAEIDHRRKKWKYKQGEAIGQALKYDLYLLLQTYSSRINLILVVVFFEFNASLDLYKWRNIQKQTSTYDNLQRKKKNIKLWAFMKENEG